MTEERTVPEGQEVAQEAPAPEAPEVEVAEPKSAAPRTSEEPASGEPEAGRAEMGDAATGTDAEEAEATLAEAEKATAEADAEEAEAALAEEGAAEAEPKEAEAERQEGRAWYVVHCYSGYENRVKKTLERRIESMGMQDKIFQVVVPVEEEVELRDGKRRTVERRLFPGYILVDMILTEDSWYVVRNTPNVTGFVGTGNKPTPLSQEQVDKILQRLESEAPRVKVSYRVGQKVRIIEGPFADFIGVVDEIYPDKGRVRILVSIFGRETPMEVDFLQIERV